jgi:sec-independent protein translocase protein TatB
VFGMSFGELAVLLIVAVVVLGPKELPRYLRKAGQLAGRLRRLAYEMREKSGIDEVLRTEGIDKDIAEIRRLARGELTGVAAAVRSTADLARIGPAGAGAGTAAGAAAGTAAGAVAAAGAVPATGAGATVVASNPYARTQFATSATADVQVEREREYPREGADSYSALPDTATVYDGSLPASPLVDDALYARGEAA